MNKKSRALPVIAALIAAQLACNLPAAQPSLATPLPAPAQTLTALFAFTPRAQPTATFTLPPVISPTPTESSGATAPSETPDESQAGGGIGPTATSAPPTATFTPTATLVPAATRTRTPQPPTATSAPVYTRPSFTANYLATPPDIDGDWGEWKNLTKEYPANLVVWGRSSWTGADDLSSSYHIGWDNNYLYVAVKVHDDRYVQNATGANLYLGDSLEILLDTKLQEDIYYSKLSPDDFQLGISPGNPNPDEHSEAYLWFPSNIAGARGSVKIAAINENGIYRVEAAIPWNVFETTPASGKRFGFGLSVSDNDDSSEDLQQSMVSNIPNRVLADPTTWGELVLVK